MEKKCVLLAFLGLTLNITLMSQTTKEQADEIVISYLQSELTHPYMLYFYINNPNDGDIEITTTKDEKVKIKYICWAYFVKESLRDGCRYLFVKEDNSNLMEIISYGDSGPEDLSLWMPISVGISVNLEHSIFPYPNPVTDWITIPDFENKVMTEIFDLQGIKVLSKSFLENNRLNISFLSPGSYIMVVYSEKKIIKYRIVKKQ